MMHICAQEVAILAILVNLVQAMGQIWLWNQVTEARAITQKFKQKLIDRPTKVKTVIYGKKP